MFFVTLCAHGMDGGRFKGAWHSFEKLRDNTGLSYGLWQHRFYFTMIKRPIPRQFLPEELRLAGENAVITNKNIVSYPKFHLIYLDNIY